jgi:hypothetical protein
MGIIFRENQKKSCTFAEALEQGDYNSTLDKAFSLNSQLIHFHDVKKTIRREFSIHKLLIVMAMYIKGILSFTPIKMGTHKYTNRRMHHILLCEHHLFRR